MKILKNIFLLFVVVHGKRTKFQVLTANQISQETLQKMLNQQRILSKCTLYTAGLKGHPKVNVAQNPAKSVDIKSTNKNDFEQECKKFCNNKNNCEIYAVNHSANPPMCHWFTYRMLKDGLINWVEPNRNMKWVSRYSTA